MLLYGVVYVYNYSITVVLACNIVLLYAILRIRQCRN